MHRYIRALAVAASAVLAGHAFAHGKLEASHPANGETLNTAPIELKFQFNEPVEAAMSSVKLLGPGDKEIALDKAHAGKDDAKSIEVSVPLLEAGEYRAQWSTSGHDGHRIKGEIRFTVK